MRIAAAFLFVLAILPAGAPAAGGGYPCEDDLLEIMFVPDARVRLRAGAPVDAATDATAGVAGVLQALAWYRWNRICGLGEDELDAIRARAEKAGGRRLYDLNNIYRLRIPPGSDVWRLARDLEALPGVLRARPVPRPVPPPLPPDHGPDQSYLRPAAATPTGIDSEYAWRLPGGSGRGVTVCDLEYSWDPGHADVTKAPGSQINSDVADPGYGPDHGTAVIGLLVGDANGWGVTGICHGADLLTCGTYFGAPSPSWNVPGALAVAIANLQPGDVILLENQWDYTGLEDYVPIEWWTDFYPAPQSYNAVYAAIELAVASGIHVVETGGNGEGDSGTITWYGDSGAIVVGAGGAYAGGTFPAGDLQRLAFSTYGPRFDLQGWGEDVVTTGYGDLYDAEGPAYAYTAVFSGTSSAGAVVAGAVAACAGFWRANVSPTPIAPAELRGLLKATGTPQVTPPLGNIGPRPDLRAALESLGVAAVPAAAAPAVLERIAPNPLNPLTRITYVLAGPGDVDLAVFDARGRVVARLVDGRREAGRHTVAWNGRDTAGRPAAAGTYLVRLEAGGAVRVGKAVLLQ